MKTDKIYSWLMEMEQNYRARWSRNEKNPICTFLVGLVAQEVTIITGKYVPIQQWLRFDFFETVDNLPDNCNIELLNSRYDV